MPQHPMPESPGPEEGRDSESGVGPGQVPGAASGSASRSGAALGPTSHTGAAPGEVSHPGAARRGGDERIPVAVLGATGAVGQQFVRLLEGHPWFRLAVVAASERSEGRLYADAVRWIQETPIPAEAAGLTVQPTEPPLAGVPLVFSALDSRVAGPLEERFAQAGHLVVSNARNHRMDPAVPLLVPEVNPGHLALLDRQTTPGAIITNPNCSTIGLTLALTPLDQAFGLRRVQTTTLQAVSGSGLPGVSSLEILDNVLPHIDGEEEKMASESLKILGSLEGQAQGGDGAGGGGGREGDGARSEGPGVTPRTLPVGAQCTRVPVVDGHTQCVSVELETPAEPEAAAEVLRSFRGRPQGLGLPSAPRYPVHVLDGPDHPQPRLHRDLEGGMAVAVGRLRPCPILHLRFVTVSHNTVRGAAGGALLGGELAVAEGVLEREGRANARARGG